MPKGEHNRKLSKQTWAEVIRAYLTPSPDGTWLGCDTLAKQYGVSQSAVYYHLRKAGIPTRGPKESHAHGKQCKPVTRLPSGPAPFCKCGCGQRVVWNRRKNNWNVYVAGHYRPKRDYHSRAWLKREYEMKHRTIPDIASEFDVASSTIRKAIDKAGIPRRSQGESLRLSGAVAGPNNPAWNGGVTPERQRLYKTPEWRALVRQAFARDHYRCQRCGGAKVKGRKLHSHHIRPWASYPEGRLDLDNLVTLCGRCHRWVHSRKNTEKLFLVED